MEIMPVHDGVMGDIHFKAELRDESGDFESETSTEQPGGVVIEGIHTRAEDGVGVVGISAQANRNHRGVRAVHHGMETTGTDVP